MPTEPELLQAVLANVDEDAPRLRYAEWCDQQPDPSLKLRGEFIRLQIKLVREGKGMDYFVQAELKNRMAKLLQQAGDGWAGALARLGGRYFFRRGFVEQMTLPAGAFLEHAEVMFRLAPIRHVDLTGLAGQVERLFACPHLAKLRSLSLHDNGLSDADIWFLAQSPHLTNLWWLDLGFNRLSMSGIQSIAASKRLPRLTHLGLKNNLDDPRERLGVEGEFIVAKFLPPEGQQLEQQFGPLRWLHCTTERYNDYPPDRFAAPPAPT